MMLQPFWLKGEQADMYRVLHADVNYRIGVCGSGNLSSIHFKVQDVRDNFKVIYDNSEHDFDWKWDVNLESSRQLTNRCVGSRFRR